MFHSLHLISYLIIKQIYYGLILPHYNQPCFADMQISEDSEISGVMLTAGLSINLHYVHHMFCTIYSAQSVVEMNVLQYHSVNIKQPWIDCSQQTRVFVRVRTWHLPAFDAWSSDPRGPPFLKAHIFISDGMSASARHYLRAGKLPYI